MNFWTKQYKKLEARIIKNAPNSVINIEAAKRDSGGGSSLNNMVVKSPTVHGAKNLSDWVSATLLATDPDQPSRQLLADFYKNMELDNHLMATINNRIEPVQASPFKLVDASGVENEEITKLFKKVGFWILSDLHWKANIKELSCWKFSKSKRMAI